MTSDAHLVFTAKVHICEEALALWARQRGLGEGVPSSILARGAFWSQNEGRIILSSPLS